MAELAASLARLLAILEGKSALLRQLGLERLGGLGLQLLVGVELAQVGALVLVQHGEDASDALADGVDATNAARGAASLLRDAQLRQLLLELRELLQQVILRLLAELLDLQVGHLCVEITLCSLSKTGGKTRGKNDLSLSPLIAVKTRHLGCPESSTITYNPNNPL